MTPSRRRCRINRGVQRPVRRNRVEGRRPGHPDGHGGHPGRGGEGRQVRERTAILGQGERPRRVRQGDGAGGAGDGAGQHPTLQALRRQSGLQEVADEHGVPAGLRSAALRSATPCRETLRGCCSAPLATTAASYFTLSDIPRRYQTIGDSRRVDLLASGSSTFHAWRRLSTSSARGSPLPSGTPPRRPRRHS